MKKMNNNNNEEQYFWDPAHGTYNFFVHTKKPLKQHLKIQIQFLLQLKTYYNKRLSFENDLFGYLFIYIFIYLLIHHQNHNVTMSQSRKDEHIGPPIRQIVILAVPFVAVGAIAAPRAFRPKQTVAARLTTGHAHLTRTTLIKRYLEFLERGALKEKSKFQVPEGFLIEGT